ncbi:MAG: MFS transporter [Pyrinomonadaceae bacterium]|nr:MFS transporter [Pyrinomonadaceae bacterium]
MPGKIKSYFSRYKNLSGNVLALSLVSLLNDTSSEIIYPILPAFLAITLGATPFAIGLIEGFAETVSSLLKLFSGYLSDRFEKRKLLVFAGYSLSSLMRPLLAFVSTWQQVLVLRVTDRTGKGIRGAPRDALIADSIEPQRRGLAFGFHRAADHFGAVIGPLIAFALLYLWSENPSEPTANDYSRIFLIAAIPAILSVFVIAFLVKEQKHEPADAENVTPIKLSLKEFDGNFKRFLIVIALFTLSNSTDAFLLLRATQAGVAEYILPLLWVFLHISKVVFSLIGGDLSDRVGRKKMIFAGCWILYALVYVGFAFVSELWQIWTLFFIYGAYFGLTEGVEKALVADLVESEKRGTAFGFYNLAFGITVFPASLIFGALWTKFGAETAFLVSSGISILAAILLLSVKSKAKS